MWCIDPLLGNDSVNTFPLETTRATTGCLLLGNGSVNMPKTIRDKRRRGFPRGPPRSYITRSSREQLVVAKNWESSVGEEFESVVENWVEFWRWQSKVTKDNGKKGIKLCQEDFMCDLKWQWDCYTSVARTRLVKTVNPSVCVCVCVCVCV
jgi:hypothetical protein